ncbi:luciferin 4-monooxygenase-like [Lasioglossum baleicum]|uniref:luciferin 4-monooxygenase-like n=1 Tax=Lasioglossum baleicum TaxID=434251 RepID=UPI003FCCB1A8
MSATKDENVQSSEKPFIIENNVIVGKKKPLLLKYTSGGKYLYDVMKNNLNVVTQLDPLTGKEDTIAELLDRAVRCALWLKKNGVRKGDIIALASHNNRDCFIPCLAALFIGATFNPWDPGMNTHLALHCIRVSEPKVIFADQELASVALDAVKIEISAAKVVTFGDYPGSVPFVDVLQAHSELDVADFQCEDVDINDTALILFSSGTTGLPKGVELSHKMVLISTDTSLGFDLSHERALWFGPMSWISGVVFSLKVLASGGKKIIGSNFEPQIACELIEKYKITWAIFSPSMANRMVRYKDLGNYDFSSLRILHVGGAILKSGPQEMMKKQLPHTAVIQGYGMTEIGGAVAAQKPSDSSGSCGTVCINYEMKIIDLQSGEALGPNQQGELCIKSESIMNGYHKNPTATKEAIDEDGWMHTGDRAYYNEDGELFIVDRIKEILKYRSSQISPSEIENLLLTHPGVLEVAVVGIPHPTDDEHPVAFVRKVPDKEVSADELMMKVEKTFVDAYKLRGGVKFVTIFPYTSSGKIARSQLRNIAKSFAVN